MRDETPNNPPADTLISPTWCRTARAAANLVLACVLTATSCVTASADEGELPKLEDMQLPSFQELMGSDIFDWVVLKSGGVIVCEPLQPRPDTLTKMSTEKDLLEAAGNEGTTEDREERRSRIRELQKLDIYLPGDGNGYEIALSRVDRIISFEELMLKRLDILLTEGDIASAYQLLRAVEQMVPDWEPTRRRFKELLFREAETRLEDGDSYACLALLEEVAARFENDPRVPELFGDTVDQLVSESVQTEDYGKARYVLQRLARLFPKHAVVNAWQERLRQQMESTLSAANELFESADFPAAAELAAKAKKIWEPTGNAFSLQARIVMRHQRLRVPVTSFADDDIVSPVPTAADRRHNQLTRVSLFEPSDADQLTYFQSSIFDVWDPQDLGREVAFSLRQSRPYWETQPNVSANQIAETLTRQLRPGTAEFNPRMASFVRRFSAKSPTQLQVSFRRVPLRLEALFRFPITVRGAEGEPEILSHRFQLTHSDRRQRVYRRVIPEPDGLTGAQYHVAEVVETKYADRHAILQAFTRGEIDMIPHLLPWEIEPFLLSGIAYTRQYAIPQNHVIVFNPRSDAVKNAQLRRALSFGVDREKMLQIIILRDQEMKYGRINSAPWPTDSYASNPLVPDPTYDHYLSYLLRFAAEEQLKLPIKQEFVAAAKAAALKAEQHWDEDVYRLTHADEINAAAEHIKLPTLRMVCEADDVALLACEKMIERWAALGFDIELIPANQEGEQLGDEDWDMMYRVTQMHEPLLDLWSLLLTDDKFDVERLASYPDWMRQELINLDYATSFKDAQEKLFRIHRQIEAQAFLIPLWELDDYVAFRRDLAGTRERPIREYDSIEQWSLHPGGRGR